MKFSTVVFGILFLTLTLTSSLFAQEVSRSLSPSYKHYGILNIGEPTPNIILSDINGKETSLSYFKGRYILIQFWASWCKPCRAENPIIKDIYLRYRNSNFQNGKEFLVLSISLDENDDDWKRAVHEDNIYDFVNVIDKKGVNSDVAKQYNVSSIPANILIDGAGNIVAKHFRANELDDILKKHVN